MNREDLVIFDTSPAVIVADMLADYAALTGRVVNPADPEMLLINALAYREMLVKEQCNEAIRQSVVAFATAPMLDFLGQFVGVTRLAAVGALTTLTFTASGANAAPIVVPSGTRVATSDGGFVFETTQDLVLPIASLGGSVEAVCQTTGLGGNGATLTVILDPQPYITSVSNTPPTGGSATETDDELRERIFLAPNDFSTAGPSGGYESIARKAHPSIIDVDVPRIPYRPGVVRITVLVSDNNGVPTQAILNAVEAACNPDTVRPICDTVQALAPAVTTYNLAVNLELYKGQNATTVRLAVNKALAKYVAERRAALGQDVVIEQIVARAMVAGVYKATVITPAATIVIPDNGVAVNLNINTTVTGFNNG